MNRFYLAASFTRREEAVAVARKIEELTRENKNENWVCVSSWLQQTEGYPKDINTIPPYIGAADFAELACADFLVTLTGDKTSRGGRHTELGFAIARGLPVILVGPREQVFHTLHAVNVFDTTDAFYAYLQRRVHNHSDAQAACNSGPENAK